MAILKVARLGNPVLRKKGRNLTKEDIHSAKIGRLIDDMIETMREYSGIGLAAPQVHESLQLAIIEFSQKSGRYPDMGKLPLTVLFNPKITVLGKKTQKYWEGCLSIPELRGLVERPSKIRVEYLDRQGKSQKVIAEGFLATVFQHELDHLQGTLYIDRVKDTTRLSFLDEYKRYWEPGKDEEEGELGD